MKILIYGYGWNGRSLLELLERTNRTCGADTSAGGGHF